MNDYQSPSFRQSSQLFSAIFGSYLESLGDVSATPDAYILISSQSPQHGNFHDAFFASLYDAACWVSELNERGENVFFGVNPRKQESSKKNAVSHIITLQVDADDPRLVTERKLKRMKPSAIVRSGQGFHAYFLLERALHARQHTNIAEDLNRRLALSVGGDLQAVDISRRLRVPGTSNWKSVQSPKAVEILELNADRRFPFDHLVKRYGSGQASQPTRGNSERPDARPRRLLSADKRAYRDELLRRGLFEYHSRNQALMILGMHCYEEGLSPSQAVSWLVEFFTAHHNDMSEDWLNNQEACIRQIHSAVINLYQKAPSWHLVGKPDTRISEEDRKFIEAQNLTCRDKIFLLNALQFIKDNERNGIILLSARQVRRFRNGQNYKAKLSLLERLGVIELIQGASKKGRKAAEYRVLYKFGEGKSRDAERTAEHSTDVVIRLILLGLSTKEIRRLMPGVSRQCIHYHRQRLDDRARQDSYLEG